MKQDKFFETVVGVLIIIAVLMAALMLGVIILGVCDYIKEVAGPKAALGVFIGIVVLALGLCIGFFSSNKEKEKETK